MSSPLVMSMSTAEPTRITWRISRPIAGDPRSSEVRTTAQDSPPTAVRRTSWIET